MKHLAALLLICWGVAAQTADCREEIYLSESYSICEVDLSTEDLRLFHTGPDGNIFGHFWAVDEVLSKQGKFLSFAMNAGMYHEDRAPVGHYLEAGVETQKIITSAGPGNFGLLPNGVFCMREGRADVIETRAFVDAGLACTYATQSGPMLVIDGALHPRFLEDSTSEFIRNGVGTSADGKRAVFAISNSIVNFHNFGSLFRDHLMLPNALYFDGNVSRIRAPELGRDDIGFGPLGPIVGVVADMVVSE